MQADSAGRAVRVGAASEGVAARYEADAEWALEAAAHGLGNVVFVAPVPKDACKAIGATLMWQHRDELPYNHVGTLRAPPAIPEIVHRSPASRHAQPSPR